MEILLTITPNPALSVVVWLLLVVMTLYLARKPSHRFLHATGRAVYNALRMAAASVRLVEKRLQIRNHEVVLNTGMAMAERKIEREFERIGAEVQRDLEGYPRLQRSVMQGLTKLEEDYTKSTLVPQHLPDWVKVIDAIANIKPSGDQMVIHVLQDIHHTLGVQYRSALESHRRDVAERHTILSRILPFWRGVQRSLNNVEKAIDNLLQRSRSIDRHMERYQQMINGVPMVRRHLELTAVPQFLKSILVLAVAAVAATISFNLVALSMAEALGGNSYLGSFKTSDVAAGFMVGLNVVVGFFLMDLIRVTGIFPMVGHLEQHKRRTLFWICLIFLTVLAAMEASLVMLRDRMLSDVDALRHMLSGDESSVAPSRIAVIGQITLGFLLPFFLAFVAIPFESFFVSSRTVLGMLTAWLLRVIAFILRLCGNIGFSLGRLAVHVYDLIIFPALWTEETIARTMAGIRERRED